MKILDKIKEIAFAFDRDLFSDRNLHLSFIIYKGRIISIGQNSKKTHPINLKNRKINKDGVDISSFRGSCSEWSAISKLKNLTNIPACKCQLINIRINKQNEIRMAKPCISCLGLISHYGFQDIWFSNEKGEFKRLIV